MRMTLFFSQGALFFSQGRNSSRNAWSSIVKKLPWANWSATCSKYTIEIIDLLKKNSSDFLPVGQKYCK